MNKNTRKGLKLRKRAIGLTSVLLASWTVGLVAPSVLTTQIVDATTSTNSTNSTNSGEIVDLSVTVTVDNKVQTGYPKIVRTLLSEFESSPEFKAIKTKFGSNPRVSYNDKNVTIEYSTRTETPQVGFELDINITGYEFNGVRPFTSAEKRDKAIERLKAKYDIKIDETNPSKWVVTGSLKATTTTTTTGTTTTTSPTTTTGTTTTTSPMTTTETTETTETTVTTESPVATTETTATTGSPATTTETTVTTGSPVTTTAVPTTAVNSRVTISDYYGSGVEVDFSTEEGALVVEVLRHIEPTSANPIAQLADKDYDVYDIKVKDSRGNFTSQLKNRAIVKMPVDTGKVVEVVVYVSEDGQLQNMPILKQENGFIYFEAWHFSLYGVIYKSTDTSAIRPTVTVTKANQNQASVSGGQATKAKPSSKQLPKTGTENSLYILVSGMILSILAFVGFKKKED